MGLILYPMLVWLSPVRRYSFKKIIKIFWEHRGNIILLWGCLRERIHVGVSISKRLGKISVTLKEEKMRG